jgi:hypothetical protein
MFGRIFSGFFLGRFLIALIVVFAFYNASGFSYYHWVTGGTSFDFGMIVVGLAFAFAFAFFVYSTMRASAKFIYLMFLAFVMACVWWMHVSGLISLSDPTMGTIVAEILIAFMLALGSVWSIIWRSRTGQVSVDDPDTGNN